MTDQTFQIKGSQLRRLVEPVLPFTDQDRHSLPALEAVLFRSHGGHLYATATDRYRLGVQRVALDAPDGMRFLLSGKSIRAILSLYRGTKLHDPELELTVGDGKVKVTGAGSLGFSSDSWTSWDLCDAEYPKVDTILGDAIKRARESTTAGAFNAAYLGDFKQAALHSDGVTPVQMWTAENKPSVIRVGDDFIAALMPVRVAGEGAKPLNLDLDESWSAIVGTPTPEAVPA